MRSLVYLPVAQKGEAQEEDQTEHDSPKYHHQPLRAEALVFRWKITKHLLWTVYKSLLNSLQISIEQYTNL